jgi:hypothetical protein
MIGRGPTGSTLGQGRREDQCSDPRTQTEEKYHTNPIMRQGDVRVEQDAKKTYHCVDIEIGEAC